METVPTSRLHWFSSGQYLYTALKKTSKKHWHCVVYTAYHYYSVFFAMHNGICIEYLPPVRGLWAYTARGKLVKGIARDRFFKGSYVHNPNKRGRYPAYISVLNDIPQYSVAVEHPRAVKSFLLCPIAIAAGGYPIYPP